MLVSRPHQDRTPICPASIWKQVQVAGLISKNSRSIPVLHRIMWSLNLCDRRRFCFDFFIKFGIKFVLKFEFRRNSNSPWNSILKFDLKFDLQIRRMWFEFFFSLRFGKFRTSRFKFAESCDLAFSHKKWWKAKNHGLWK